MSRIDREAVIEFSPHALRESVAGDGSIVTTNVNTYSGDNARAAILGTNGLYYTVGNTGGTDATNSGVQAVTPGGSPASNSTSLGSYNVTQNGFTAAGKRF